jgi:hypothetical protein
MFMQFVFVSWNMKNESDGKKNGRNNLWRRARHLQVQSVSCSTLVKQRSMSHELFEQPTHWCVMWDQTRSLLSHLLRRCYKTHIHICTWRHTFLTFALCDLMHAASCSVRVTLLRLLPNCSDRPGNVSQYNLSLSEPQFVTQSRRVCGHCPSS